MALIATGVTLLRIVDPEFKSKTLEDYGVAYILISFLEILLLTVMPMFVAQGYIFVVGAILLAITLGLWIFTAMKYGVHKEPASQIRPGEAEIINS